MGPSMHERTRTCTHTHLRRCMDAHTDCMKSCVVWSSINISSHTGLTLCRISVWPLHNQFLTHYCTWRFYIIAPMKVSYPELYIILLPEVGGDQWTQLDESSRVTVLSHPPLVGSLTKLAWILTLYCFSRSNRILVNMTNKEMIMIWKLLDSNRALPPKKWINHFLLWFMCCTWRNIISCFVIVPIIGLEFSHFCWALIWL